MQRSEAIVLGQTPYSESSVIVRLLTPRLGVVRALARGARRPGSRHRGGLEPFAYLSVMIAPREGDRLGTLGETSVIEGWDYLRSDVTRLAYAGLAVETVGRVAELSPPEPFFHEELLAYLRALGEVPGAGSLTIALLLRLLHASGFPPRIEGFDEDERLPQAVAYDFIEGTLVDEKTAGPHIMRLPGRAIEAIRTALDAPPPLSPEFNVRGADGPPLLRWLIRVWEDHLNARLQSADFLEEMVLKRPRPER